MKRFRLFGMLESCKKAMRTAGLAIERLETVLHSLLWREVRNYRWKSVAEWFRWESTGYDGTGSNLPQMISNYFCPSSSKFLTYLSLAEAAGCALPLSKPSDWTAKEDRGLVWPGQRTSIRDNSSKTPLSLSPCLHPPPQGAGGVRSCDSWGPTG